MSKKNHNIPKQKLAILTIASRIFKRLFGIALCHLLLLFGICSDSGSAVKLSALDLSQFAYSLTHTPCDFSELKSLNPLLKTSPASVIEFLHLCLVDGML